MAINKIISSKNQTPSSLKNCLNYVMRKDKAVGISFVGPRQPDKLNPQNVYDVLWEEKELWGKTTGRQYMHSVLSFAKNDKVTPEQALEIAVNMATNDEFYRGFQSVVCVHGDRDHIHVHFVTNTVSYVDGTKEHHNKCDVENLMMRTNKMCEKLDLNVCKKGYHMDGTVIEDGNIATFRTKSFRALHTNDKNSYLAECAVAVESAKNAGNKDEFIKSMKELGWSTIWTDERKYITFVNDETGKRVRNINLCNTFNLKYLESKETLTNELTRQTRISRIEGTAISSTNTTNGTENFSIGTTIGNLGSQVGEVKQAGEYLLKTGISEAQRQEKATQKANRQSL